MKKDKDQPIGPRSVPFGTGPPRDRRRWSGSESMTDAEFTISQRTRLRVKASSADKVEGTELPGRFPGAKPYPRPVLRIHHQDLDEDFLRLNPTESDETED